MDEEAEVGQNLDQVDDQTTVVETSSQSQKPSEHSVNFGSPAASKKSEETDVEDNLIDLDTEKSPETNLIFDDLPKAEEEVDKGSISHKSVRESEKAVRESEKAVRESEKAVGESEKADRESEKAVGESEKAVGESEKAVGESEKAVRESEKAVVQKISYDETDQIQPTNVPTEEINLDNIRKSINDPNAVGQAKNIFGKPRQPLGPVVDFSSSESSLEEEEELELDLRDYFPELGLKRTEKEPINREEYEEEYKNLKEQSVRLRRRNGLLNKKLTEYYRKRKMVRVFGEMDPEAYDQVYEKYEEKIEDFCNLQAKTLREREAIDMEMDDMICLRDEQLAELEKSFSEMQARERFIGHGLIDLSTGKTISDKLVQRLLSRQEAKSKEISVIRLAFIKRRDKVKALDNQIKALETIGGTLHLMDFEQLRMENQTFSDKIEERDEELMRLRDRYSHAMQALAHIRKKNNIIETQIEDLEEKKFIEQENASKSRELLNQLKIQRDANRAHREKLKYNSGILTYPKLLQDMEKGMYVIEELRRELENLKSVNKENRSKLTNIRILMERFDHVQAKRERRRMPASRGSHKYYKSRPSLLYPILPKIAYFKSRVDKMSLNQN